jgi:5-methylcytosine-specific restriction endonuclease McrA
MPTARASKICPKCLNLSPCPVHEGRKVTFDRSYLPRDWGRRRRLVLERDPICVLCGEARSQEVDHVGSKYDHSLGNLRGVCSPCHHKRTLAQSHDAKARKRELEVQGLW